MGEIRYVRMGLKLIHQPRKHCTGLCEILPLPGVQAAQLRHLHPLVHYGFVLSL